MPSAPLIRYAVCISILKDPEKNMLKITAAVKFPLLIISFVGSSLGALAQSGNQQDTGQSLTLDQCVAYALKNQPTLHQSLINTDIARATNGINLSGWLPQ